MHSTGMTWMLLWVSFPRIAASIFQEVLSHSASDSTEKPRCEKLLPEGLRVFLMCTTARTVIGYPLLAIREYLNGL
jgi:hypothetical protein